MMMRISLVPAQRASEWNQDRAVPLSHGPQPSRAGFFFCNARLGVVTFILLHSQRPAQLEKGHTTATFIPAH